MIINFLGLGDVAQNQSRNLTGCELSVTPLYTVNAECPSTSEVPNVSVATSKTLEQTDSGAGTKIPKRKGKPQSILRSHL